MRVQEREEVQRVQGARGCRRGTRCRRGRGAGGGAEGAKGAGVQEREEVQGCKWLNARKKKKTHNREGWSVRS